MTQWPFAYTPGRSWVLCGPRLAVLVPAGLAPEVMLRLRQVVADPTRVLDEALEALIAPGLRFVSDFGILQPGPHGARVVVRGEVTARLGDQEVVGSGLWTDLQGAPGMPGSLAMGEAAPGEPLPLGAGLVLASAVAEVVWSPDEGVVTPADVVELPVEVEEPPVAVDEPEPESGPSGHTLPGLLVSPGFLADPAALPTEPIPVAEIGATGPPAPLADADSVLSCTCLRGHPNPPLASTCRVCGEPIPSQPPVRLPRPPLGVLRFVNGDAVVLDRGCILGRNPRVPDDAVGEAPRLVRLNDPDKDVSSQHLALSLDGWEVSVRDLGSTNGTEVTLPGRLPQPLLPGQALTIVPGTVLVLAGVLTVSFEAPLP